MTLRYLDLSDEPISYDDFIYALNAFRQSWTREDFWALSNEHRNELAWALVHDFNRMEGTLDQIATASVGMQGAIMEYKLRHQLLREDGKTT
jgi:hypothetical protein